MAGFEFQVRRPLGSKVGVLFEGDVRRYFKLEWPTLQISNIESFDSAERFPIEDCSFFPLPTGDSTLNGKQAYCIYVKNNRDGSAKNWFAETEHLRREWCFLLRKHAVHHNVSNGFKITDKVLGYGAMAVVKLGLDLLTLEQQAMLKECCPRNQHTLSTERVALKLISKSTISKDEDRQLLTEEIRIAQAVNNEYCVSTREFIETIDTYILVMEVAEGGELFELMSMQMFPEDEVRRIMRQILLGVAYLHSRGICHRDLKPENFLLVGARTSQIKIADYGIAVDVDPAAPGTCIRDRGGRLRCSPGYGAPEVVRQEAYGLPCDMWSVGVCLYTLLTGIQPFTGPSDSATRALMLRGDFDYTPLQRRSPLAGDLVARLLDKNPATRISAQAALDHTWVKAADPPAGPSPAAAAAAAAADGGKEAAAGAGGCWCGLLAGGAARRRRGGGRFADPSCRALSQAEGYAGIVPSDVDSSVRLGVPCGGAAHPAAEGGGGGGGGVTAPLVPLVRTDSRTF